MGKNEAARIKAMAERRIGELIPEMQERGELAKKGGDQKSKSQLATLISLEELGLTKSDSSRFQREAQLSDNELDDLFHECNENGVELTAERDENTCRKEFTTLEQVALGEEIEKLERPKAKERQLSGG